MKLINLLATVLITFGGNTLQANEITIATFNVSMEAENYVSAGTPLGPHVLAELLAKGNHPQIKNIAAIIQQIQPDILLLNEFDYISDPKKGVELFIKNYLAVSQVGGLPIQYPYYFYRTVNTGVPSGFDLDRDGKANNGAEDAWGFGHYPGQYGMMVLSRYPIDAENTRTFQHFKWRDMPGHRKPQQANGSDWFNEETMAKMPLSSKSHWDIPVLVNGKPLHLLVSHPTPPVFDGPENRNGHRNHDEVRFWVDYLNDKNSYHYDDQGKTGGYQSDAPFVILGDLNSSPDEGDSHKEAITALLNHPKIQQQPVPSSKGGALNMPKNPKAQYHTAFWKMRADYVLPAKKGLQVVDAGVFWPTKTESNYHLVASREASSDHRLVWIKVKFSE